MALHALLATGCPLVPIPFLDEHLLRRVRERQVRSLASQLDVKWSEGDVALLAGTRRPFRPLGCFVGAILTTMTKIVLTLFRRLLRKLLFFLTVKEAIDEGSRTFHEGVLLGTVFAAPGSPLPSAVRLRDALDATTADIDPRPIQQILRRSLRGSRAFLAWFLTHRGHGSERAQRRWRSLVDDVASELWEQEGYLRALEASFRSHLEPPLSAPGALPDSM